MSPGSLPPLSAIRCFEAAARHGNFTAAAAELGMTQAAVSYQIRLLEERLGAGLFLRRPRGVELTTLGAQLAPRVREAFALLRQTFDDAQATGAGTLVVDSVATFASNWLAGRLGAFQIRHPELAVRLTVSQHLVDFAREEVHVAIRSGPGGWPGLVEHALLPVEFTPMIGRSLAAEHRFAEPADLLKVPLVDPEDPWWREWFAAEGIDLAADDLRPGISVATQALAARAAIGGQGAAILTPAFFRDELSSGILVQPFPRVEWRGHSYFLVYPETRRHAPRVRAFRDWLLETVATDGPV